MCTVSFLPLEEGYILTSNRDEDPGREKAQSPGNYLPDKADIYFPRDPVGSGSWIAFNSSGKTICLLNGGRIRHKRKLPYRQSRGLVTLAAFDFDSPYDFKKHFNLDRIEPFTLVWIESKSKVYSVVWDGSELGIEERDATKAWIWSSVTLYDEDTRLKRRKWFKEWLGAHPTYEQKDILRFHHFGGEGDSATNFMMERKGLIPKTISVTSVKKQKDGVHYLYEDLLNDQIHEGSI